jgi:cell division FtsZ-interacting protein ZapD
MRTQLRVHQAGCCCFGSPTVMVWESHNQLLRMVPLGDRKEIATLVAMKLWICRLYNA